MSARHVDPPDRGAGALYSESLDAERTGWYEVVGLCQLLTPEERLAPGYYVDPDWNVRDVVTHLGTWLAEAASQLERIHAGTYEGHNVDVDGLNEALLAGMADQPWPVTWVQAHAGRTIMLQSWHALEEPSDEAAWWIRKSAAEHFAEHLPRLRAWVAELIARR
jgi:hypothetical protein